MPYFVSICFKVIFKLVLGLYSYNSSSKQCLCYQRQTHTAVWINFSSIIWSLYIIQVKCLKISKYYSNHMTQLKTPSSSVGKFSNTKITDIYSLWITLIYIISWRWLCLSACEPLGSIFFFHLHRQTIPLSSDPVSFQSCNINCTLKISSLMLILTN